MGQWDNFKGARLASIVEPIMNTESEFWELVAACFGIADKFEPTAHPGVHSSQPGEGAGGAVRAQA